jgi:hypothetical protein
VYSLLVDAGVLAVPPVESARDDVHSYVQRLIDCGTLLSESWIALCMSDDARDALFENALYPLRPHLSELFAAKNIIEFDPNTVALVADKLLHKVSSFEGSFGVTDVLTTDLATKPDLLSSYTPRCLLTHFERCVVLAAVLKTQAEEPKAEHMLASKSRSGATEVQVDACIHEIDYSRADLDALPTAPDQFEGSISLCQDFSELVSDIDEVAMWHSAQIDPLIVRTAVKTAVYKSRIQRGMEPVWEDLPSFSLGTEFLERTRRCCMANPRTLLGRVLRAMVETLDDLALKDVHALRVEEGGSAPQKMRGRDKAFRRDIDSEYRLHYWDCQDGTKEFASVGPHNDIGIPE